MKPLSPREHQVFVLMAAGKTTREIAGELGITRRTVETHRRGVYEKTGMHSLGEIKTAAGCRALPQCRAPHCRPLVCLHIGFVGLDQDRRSNGGR
jgi:DNA-binding CsgD family transcriptional regulator